MRYAVPLMLRTGTTVHEDRDVIVEAADSIDAQETVKRWFRAKQWPGLYYAEVGNPQKTKRMNQRKRSQSQSQKLTYTPQQSESNTVRSYGIKTFPCSLSLPLYVLDTISGNSGVSLGYLAEHLLRVVGD